MGFTKMVTLWCDADDCFEFVEDGSPTASEARKFAARSGWTYKNGRDYCPDHGPEDDSETHD